MHYWHPSFLFPVLRLKAFFLSPNIERQAGIAAGGYAGGLDILPHGKASIAEGHPKGHANGQRGARHDGGGRPGPRTKRGSGTVQFPAWVNENVLNFMFSCFWFDRNVVFPVILETWVSPSNAICIFPFSSRSLARTCSRTCPRRESCYLALKRE